MRKYLFAVLFSAMAFGAVAHAYGAEAPAVAPVPVYVILADVVIKGEVVDTEVYTRKTFSDKASCEAFLATDEYKAEEARLGVLAGERLDPGATIKSRCDVKAN